MSENFIFIHTLMTENNKDLPSKHAGSDLEVFCSQNWAGLYMPDLTSCIRFGSILSKKAWIILCETGPDLIWMA